MIRGVPLENMMMNQRVLLKRIPEALPGLVHEETVQRPFKKRGKDHPRSKSNRKPKKERNHNKPAFQHAVEIPGFLDSTSSHMPEIQVLFHTPVVTLSRRRETKAYRLTPVAVILQPFSPASGGAPKTTLFQSFLVVTINKIHSCIILLILSKNHDNLPADFVAIIRLAVKCKDSGASIAYRIKGQ